jgi:hypothetical protein
MNQLNDKIYKFLKANSKDFSTNEIATAVNDNIENVRISLGVLCNTKLVVRTGQKNSQFYYKINN